jgi:hypothetical protein
MDVFQLSTHSKYVTEYNKEKSEQSEGRFTTVTGRYVEIFPLQNPLQNCSGSY